MRIGVDARELAGHATGVGRYLGELLAHWATEPAAAGHEFVLFADRPLALPPPAGREGALPAGLAVTSVVSLGDGTMWEQFTLPALVRESGAAVLFSPGYTAPLRLPIPRVVAIHDVSFAVHPEWFSWREGARRRTITRMTAERAARVLTISEFSKREIVTHLGVSADKVSVIYPGLTRLPASPAMPHDPRPTTHSPCVLFVGSIFNRRHVPDLIAGFGRLAATYPDITLEIVGDNRSSPRQDLVALAQRSGAADRIHARAYVDDGELANLYRRARAFAFLSDYEGFGLTPLEALGQGVPIAVLDTPVAREVYGDAAIRIARPEPALIASALQTLLFDEAARERQLGAAIPVLARYSWPACAARVLGELVAAGAAR